MAKDSVQYTIPAERFEGASYLDARLAGARPEDRGALKTALGYLYLQDGPVNLPRNRLKAAEPYLDPTERLLARWLSTRTNGSLRASYGTRALESARAARYRCQECGHGDVRVLNLDHVNGHVAGTPFACLCANCHAIKSRRDDWTGVGRR